MYEISLDVYAYMMRFCPCVFLFPRKRKRREVTWCSDFVSNSPQAPLADSISADSTRRQQATVGSLSKEDDDGDDDDDDDDDGGDDGGSENVRKTNEFAFFQT